VVGWFVCPTNPESYAGWSVVLLVGPPMPDRSKDRGLTKSDPLALQVGGLAQGQQPCPVKEHYVTETVAEDTTTTVCRGLSESPQMTRMNGSGEIRIEATDRIMKVLGTKTKTRIGFWNVRALYQTGKLAQVTVEMRRYCLHILGVRESRWTGSGRVKTSTGETVLYAGRDDNQHHEGVVIILKKGLEKYLLEWKPINSRLMTARMQGKHVNLSLVQCYAPTNDSDDTTKDSFYAQLQAELEKLPRHDMLVIMGDLNAKVGRDNSSYDRAMGKEGCGTMNENGERLAELCAAYNLVIGGTIFPHRDIHKLTWCSPNGRDRNQIDHLMINGTWRRSLLDVKVRRGADVGSNHHLVTAYVKLKLRSTCRKPSCNQRFNTDNLKEPSAKNAFITQLRNRFQSLAVLSDEPEPDEINNIWKQVSFTFTESSEACLDFKKVVEKMKWIKLETLRAIEGRRNLNKKLLDTKSERLLERYKIQYREADRSVKRMARADKRAYIDELASQTENAANRGEQGNVYKITKLVCGKYGGRKVAPVKDLQGRLLTTKSEQEARWAEHFKDVLNRPPPTVEADIQEAETRLRGIPLSLSPKPVGRFARISWFAKRDSNALICSGTASICSSSKTFLQDVTRISNVDNMLSTLLT